MIEANVDHEIPQYSRKEIDSAFDAELGFRVRKALTRGLSGEMPEDEMPESDFLRKSARIELLAQKLTKEIDDLAEIGTLLLVRFRTHNQNMTVAARAMADRNTLGHRSYRVATRRQSLSLPNILSMRLRRL